MLLAVSVTLNSTVRPSGWRFNDPCSTSPPRRNSRPCGASWANTCDGLKKNTRLLRKAFSISAAAMPSMASPPIMSANRLRLGFIGSHSIDLPAGASPLDRFSAGCQCGKLDDDEDQRHAVRTPYVESVATHGEEFLPAIPVHGVAASASESHSRPASRSRMMQRTRPRAIAMEYIQNAIAMTSIPHSMVRAIVGAAVRLTEAPW